MAPVVTMSQLLEAGVHYGHRTQRWNPKMEPYIHSQRHGVYVIDLRKTLRALGEAYIFVKELASRGETLLIVGTKPSIKENVKLYAEKCNMPYVNERWLGGTLTNFTTISSRTAKLKEFQDMLDAGDFDQMPKREALQYGREMARLERNLGGIRHMKSVPDAIFILDTLKEHIAVVEAQKLGIPTIGVVDTNCNPEEMDYVIPGNDDSILAGQLMCRVISEAVIAGRQQAQQEQAQQEADNQKEEAEQEQAQQEAAEQQTEAQQPQAQQEIAQEQAQPTPPAVKPVAEPAEMATLSETAPAPPVKEEPAKAEELDA